MGRRKSGYRGEKRRKELKRFARQEVKRRRRCGQDGERGEGSLTLEDWIQTITNLQRKSGDGAGEGPLVGAGVHAPYRVSEEELEVLRSIEASAPIRWSESAAEVRNGDEVQVHYRATRLDGTDLASSHGRDPIGFTVGRGQVISGFEKAVIGMNAGEFKKVTLPCEEAYGSRREELVAQVRRSEVPENIDLRRGLEVKLVKPDGVPAVVMVTAVDAEKVTLDGNHPLAGEELNFEITVVSVGS